MINIIIKLQYLFAHTVSLAGRLIVFLPIIMVLFIAGIVLARYVFATGVPAFQEAVLVMHTALIAVGVGWGWQQNAHVSIDFLSAQFSTIWKKRIQLATIIFLVWPVCALLMVTCWPYVAASYALGEVSAEEGGLPYVWLHKGLLLLMPIVWLLHSLYLLFMHIQGNKKP